MQTEVFETGLGKSVSGGQLIELCQTREEKYLYDTNYELSISHQNLYFLKLLNVIK